MAHFLADEHIPKSAIAALRAAGHGVLSAKESMAGAEDAELLAKAVAERRVVLTEDKDFGELAFLHGLPAECGIILFRLPGTNSQADSARIVEVVLGRPDWSGQFAVADESRIRMRDLSKP